MNNNSTIPDIYPAEGQYPYRSDSPLFLIAASLGEGQFLLKERWGKLTPEQQEYVQKSLGSRGLKLYQRSDSRMPVIQLEGDGCPVRVRSANDGYAFYCEDPRIMDSDSITIRVDNASSREEAVGVLNNFLNSIRTIGATAE